MNMSPQINNKELEQKKFEKENNNLKIKYDNA